MPSRIHRRRFLEQMSQAAQTCAAASVLGATLAGNARKANCPNDTLNIASLGTGGRCRRLMERVNMIDGVRIVGVADVWDEHLAKGAELADPKATRTKHYQELLDRKDVDAVVIGAPDHWHVPMTIDACRAGKDVYVEKPLTHDLFEGQAVIEAQQSPAVWFRSGPNNGACRSFSRRTRFSSLANWVTSTKCISPGIAIKSVGGNRISRSILPRCFGKSFLVTLPTNRLTPTGSATGDGSGILEEASSPT